MVPHSKFWGMLTSFPLNGHLMLEPGRCLLLFCAASLSGFPAWATNLPAKPGPLTRCYPLHEIFFWGARQSPRHLSRHRPCGRPSSPSTSRGKLSSPGCRLGQNISTMCKARVKKTDLFLALGTSDLGQLIWNCSACLEIMFWCRPWTFSVSLKTKNCPFWGPFSQLPSFAEIPACC